MCLAYFVASLRHFVLCVYSPLEGQQELEETGNDGKLLVLLNGQDDAIGHIVGIQCGHPSATEQFSCQYITARATPINALTWHSHRQTCPLPV